MVNEAPKDEYLRVKDVDTVPAAYRGMIGKKGEITQNVVTLHFGYWQHWSHAFYIHETEPWHGPAIETGKTEGQYFVPGKLDRLRESAFSIARVQPTATNFKVWYEAYDDFHRLSFELDGSYYEIQYYKVFSMSKDRVKDFMHSRVRNSNVCGASHRYRASGHVSAPAFD